MNRLLCFFVALFVAMLVTGCASTASVLPEATTAIDAPEGAIMIVIDDPRSERRRRGIGSPGYSSNLAYHEDPLLHRAAAKVAADHDLTLVSQWPLRNLAVHCLVVEAPSQQALQALGRDVRVRWIQPFNEFATQSVTQPERHESRPGIQQLFSTLDERGAGVRIAVVDTAIDQSHPDLSSSTIRQLNFAGSRGRPDQEEHGTAVVGLIAASASGPEGVTGFASEADVQVLRACWQPQGNLIGKCNTLTLALALDAAIDLQPEVINLSLTGRYDRVLEELLDVLLASGTIVIAAYDDERQQAERFPAARSGVIYAYGTAGTNYLSEDPSANVLNAPRHAMSLAPKASYDLVSGHSIAAPQISALAARLIEGQPDASRDEIVNQLRTWLGSE